MGQYQNPHYDVIIATPGASMENAYVLSLVHTINKLNELGITWKFISKTNSDVSIARENTILNSDNNIPISEFSRPLTENISYNKIFLIDSDIFWEFEDFMALYLSEKDIISGAYIQSNGISTTVYEKENKIMMCEDLISRKNIFEAFASGLGFTCIKNGVFEKIQRPWFSHVEEKKMLQPGEYFVDLVSEDVSFIKKAKISGFKFHIDPSVRVGHVKKVHLYW
jgi:hypothetical protein